jgi:hypothetical protein
MLQTLRDSHNNVPEGLEQDEFRASWNTEESPVDIQNQALWNTFGCNMIGCNMTASQPVLFPNNIFAPLSSHSALILVREIRPIKKCYYPNFSICQRLKLCNLKLLSSERVCTWWRNQGLQKVAYKHSWCSCPLTVFFWSSSIIAMVEQCCAVKCNFIFCSRVLVLPFSIISGTAVTLRRILTLYKQVWRHLYQQQPALSSATLGAARNCSFISCLHTHTAWARCPASLITYCCTAHTV